VPEEAESVQRLLHQRRGPRGRWPGRAARDDTRLMAGTAATGTGDDDRPGAGSGRLPGRGTGRPEGGPDNLRPGCRRPGIRDTGPGRAAPGASTAAMPPASIIPAANPGRGTAATGLQPALR
jgi:hypothetical protein